MKKKYTMVAYDEKGYYCYGWNRLQDVNDVWSFIGWLCNKSHTEIKVKYLEYYNTIFDDLKSYITRIKENKNVIVKLNFDNMEYVIKLEEEEE